MLESLISLITPHYCINCRAIGAKLCLDCKNNIVFQPLEHCVECHGWLVAGHCRSCRLPYQFVASCSARTELLEQLIDDFKFRGGRAAAQPLADIMAATLPYFPGEVMISYVPTARAHIRQRGYDHAQLLAKALAARRRYPIASLLHRRATARQVGATRKQRIAQAKGLYRATRPLRADVTYVLVDDVITTGSTIKQAAKALKQAGAQKIAVITIAYQASSKG